MLINELIQNYIEAAGPKAVETIEAAGKMIKIIPTKNLAEECKIKSYQVQHKEVRPLNLLKVLLAIFLFIDVTGAAIAVRYFFILHLSISSLVALCAGVLFLLSLPFFIILNYNKSIESFCISSTGVDVAQYHLSWDQLMETLIVKVLPGSFYQTYLVLVTHDRLIVKLSLKNYFITTTRLASAIEISKQRAVNATFDKHE